jgi:hypothetical protein
MIHIMPLDIILSYDLLMKPAIQSKKNKIDSRFFFYS